MSQPVGGLLPSPYKDTLNPVVISSCTASPESIAICGSSFGTRSALRQATPGIVTSALAATIVLGGRKAAQRSEQVEFVGDATLVREQGQGDALNPAVPMFGIYGIDKAALETLQDLLLHRLCQASNSAVCQSLLWQGLIGALPGFPFNLPNDREIATLNRAVTYPLGEVNYDIVFQDDGSGRPTTYASWQPWRLVNPSGGRAWESVDQGTRDAAAALASPEEEWGTVRRKGTLGGLSYPAGYDPNSPASRDAAGPMSIEISGTDRIFRQPQPIPGTSAVEVGGPLIQEGDDRRVGAGYPGISGFVDTSQPGLDVRQRTKPLVFAGTGTTGGSPQYREKKVGFPLPGPDGQLDSDDQMEIPPTDVCEAPCIQDIKKKVDFTADYCEELWEYFIDYALEDYRLPEENYFFDIGSFGHPKDTIIAASVIQKEPIPQTYGRFVTNFAISDFHPKNIGLLQFEYVPDIDRGQGELGEFGFRIRSEPIQVRGFGLVYGSPIKLPARAVGWSPRTGIEGRLRVFVKRFQLKQ